MEDEMQSLREENARIKAEAEANLINVEVQCQAMEARNARLATELREAREQAKRESERATEAIAAAIVADTGEGEFAAELTAEVLAAGAPRR